MITSTNGNIYAKLSKGVNPTTISYVPVMCWLQDRKDIVGCVPSSSASVLPIDDENIRLEYGDFVHYVAKEDIEKDMKETENPGTLCFIYPNIP